METGAGFMVLLYCKCLQIVDVPLMSTKLMKYILRDTALYCLNEIMEAFLFLLIQYILN